MLTKNTNSLTFFCALFIITNPLVDSWQAILPSSVTGLGPLTFLQTVRGGIILVLLFMTYKYLFSAFNRFPLIRPLFYLFVFFVVLMPFHYTISSTIVLLFQVLYVGLFAVAGMIIGAKKSNWEKWILNVGKISLLVVLAMQLYGYYTGVGIRVYGEYAMVGLTQRSNIVAIPASWIIAILLNKLNQMKAVDWVWLLLALGSLILTMRRSSILGIFVGFVLLGIFVFYSLEKTSRKNIFNIISLVIFVMVVGYIFSLTPMGENLSTRFDEMDVRTGGTAGGRTVIWEASLNHILYETSTAEFFLGVGSGNVSRAVARSMGGRGHRDPHNAWLYTIIGGGLLGFLLFTWFHLKLYQHIKFIRKQYIHYYPSTLVGISALFMWGLTSGSVFEPAWGPLYLFIGLSRGLYLRELYIKA